MSPTEWFTIRINTMILFMRKKCFPYYVVPTNHIMIASKPSIAIVNIMNESGFSESIDACRTRFMTSNTKKMKYCFLRSNPNHTTFERCLYFDSVSADRKFSISGFIFSELIRFDAPETTTYDKEYYFIGY